VSVRWAGIAEETTFGTKVATPARSLAFRELDAQPDQGLIDVEESAYREVPLSVFGPFLGSGSLSIFARPDTIGHFLKWTFGSVTSAQIGTSAMYKHTFKIADAIKSFTLSDNRGITGLSSRFLIGTLIRGLTLEAPARELTTLDLDLLYAWEDLATAPTMGTLSPLRPFVFHDGAVELPSGTALARVEAFSAKLENTIPDDTHEVGSRKLPLIILEGAAITGEVELKFESWAMRQRFYGAAAATEPQEETATVSMVLKLVGEPTGVVDKPNYEVNVTLPAVILTEQPSTVSRRERLTQTFSFKAMRHVDSRVELFNKDTAY